MPFIQPPPYEETDSTPPIYPLSLPFALEWSDPPDYGWLFLLFQTDDDTAECKLLGAVGISCLFYGEAASFLRL